MTDSKEWCDGDWRWRSSSRPFAGAESGSSGRALEAGERGSPGRAVQAGIRGKRLIASAIFLPFTALIVLFCCFSFFHRTFFRYFYCDFIEFNVANNETESKRNFTFF